MKKKKKLWKGALPSKEAQKRLEKEYIFPVDLSQAKAPTLKQLRKALK